MRNYGIFSISPLIPRIIIIAFAVSIYYFLATRGIFADWISYIDIGVKLIIGYEILRGSMYSLLAPILACIVGLVFLIAVQKYGFQAFMVSTMNGLQLIIVSFVGMLITMIRVFKK